MTTRTEALGKMEQQIDDRLGQVEVRQARLESSLDSVVREVTKLSAFVERLDGHLQQAGRPNWANWLSAITLFVAISAAFGGMFIRPIQITTANNSDKIRDLDQSLQREMRLIDATTQAKIENLDTALQREVRLLLDKRDSEVTHLKDVTQALSDELHAFQRFNMPDWERLGLPLVAKIDDLEKSIAQVRESRFDNAAGVRVEDKLDDYGDRIARIESCMEQLKQLLRGSENERD